MPIIHPAPITPDCYWNQYTNKVLLILKKVQLYHVIMMVSYPRYSDYKLLQPLGTFLSLPSAAMREKGRYLTQSCDKSPFTHRTEKSKSNVTT